MGQTPAEATYIKIEKLINSSRFNESFLLLKRELQRYPFLKKELETLKGNENTYRYMLDYIAEGNDDPSREDMMKQLKDSLFRANDIVLRESKLTDSPDLYSSTRRLDRLRNIKFDFLLAEFLKILEADRQNNPDIEKISAEQSQKLNDIFNYVWTMNGADSEEYETLTKSLENPELPEYFKSLLVSAIILGNISYFDPESFDILLNQYDNKESLALKAKVITGIVLISILHSRRISGNLNLRSRLMLSAEDEEFKKLSNSLLLNLIRTYDTKRIDNKMRNEVIPGLMKIKPELLDKMRNLSMDSDNLLSDDANPQWEELIENSDIGDKLKEITEMQLEGADVMVTAFSNLKTFPFFNNISNWFMPFVPGNHDFENVIADLNDETTQRFTDVMCESDLHSFLLSMKNMPDDRRKLMISNMEHQMKEAREAMSNSIGENDEHRIQRKIRHSLQDLYRFFKYYRKRSDFNDPFASPFIAAHLEPLVPIFCFDRENLRLVGEFYFKNKYYDEAAGIFEMINRNESDISLWEKIGFSHDRMQRFEEASQWYKKAELVNPTNEWLIKKLAISLKNAGKPEEALEYYDKALASDPENYHLLMSASQCLLDCGRNEDALNHLYHAQYLKPEKLGVKRALAWAELLAGNFDKAKAQYSKILENTEAEKTDFLNAGHCALASGDIKDSLSFYKTFIDKAPDRDITSLVIAFRDDAETLKKLNIKTGDLRLIVDKIRYDLLG